MVIFHSYVELPEFILKKSVENRSNLQVHVVHASSGPWDFSGLLGEIPVIPRPGMMPGMLGEYRLNPK
jgi:hypothetical protein